MPGVSMAGRDLWIRTPNLGHGVALCRGLRDVVMEPLRSLSLVGTATMPWGNKASADSPLLLLDCTWDRLTFGWAGFLSDLWTYDHGFWTWIGGETSTNFPGRYTRDGTALPAGRYAAISWYDSSAGRLWLFGGMSKRISTQECEAFVISC